jgi:signal transduction histidine kinase/ligand-binding sensor domain-containing protein
MPRLRGLWMPQRYNTAVPGGEYRSLGAFLFVAALVVSASPAVAQRLPIKAYTTADGLPSPEIKCVVKDPRGFLWVCTADGLSRFDGLTFVTYGKDNGLPGREVNDLLIARSGTYYVATGAGLARLDLSVAATASGRSDTHRAPALFERVAYADPRTRDLAVTAILEDQGGTIWCGTDEGLYRVERYDRQFTLRAVDIGMPRDYPDQRRVSDVTEDRFGSIWVATPAGLYRRWPDGSVARYTARDGLPDEYLHDLMLDDEGRLWVASRYGGFFRLAFDGSRQPPTVEEQDSIAEGLPSTWVFRLFEASDGRFWIGTNRGLVERISRDASGPPSFRQSGVEQGLSFSEVTTFGEDGDANLWIGTNETGLMKLARQGFLSYGARDGVAAVKDLFEDAAGELCFRGNLPIDIARSTGALAGLPPFASGTPVRFGCFDGRRFQWFFPAAIGAPDRIGWVMEDVTLRTRNGEWWLGTGTGIYRFPAVDRFTDLARAPLLAHYGGRDAPSTQIFALFEDANGGVWASTIASGGNGLARWDRASNTWTDFDGAPGLPSLKEHLPRAVGEDAEGDVWIGFDEGVARFTRGAFQFFSEEDGLPPGSINAIYRDRHDAMWLASASSGVIRVEHAGSAHPSFASYTTAQGLSSNGVSVIVDDASGRLYLGTGRGIDRLDPRTGRVEHFTTSDGLALGLIRAALRSRSGSLWFGTSAGLSEFEPAAIHTTAAPPVFITSVLLGGVRVPMSPLGQERVALPDLRPSQNRVQIDYAGFDFAPGEHLRYQYRLDGAENSWSPAVAQRSITYAGLGPGTHRFSVRAVTSDGTVSSAPAVVTLTILRPLWQRWWFLSAVALALGAIAFAVHRVRLARMMELGNLRAGIATDLHDDIGANLTAIAILSEVARQQLPPGSEPPDGPLASIGRISRESVAAMSDIVWAINPRYDRVQDLVRRMRLTAEELFSSRGTTLTFNAPDDQDLRLPADVRRDLFLIFKEAVTNAARHSGASAVRITVGADRTALSLDVSDNGRGFDGTEEPGEGLASMRRRAERAGGACQVVPADERGTSVRVRIPINRARTGGPYAKL